MDFGFPTAQVLRTLDRIAEARGYPAKLRLDNGPEFVSMAMLEWAEEHGMKLGFIRPG